MSGVRITVLVDETASEGLVAEHGLSLWIETCGRRILFDTGEEALLRNASSFGIDPREADMIVLSHGHYDHTGGLAGVLDGSSRAVVHCHPGAVVPRYHRSERGVRSIGMPGASMRALNGHSRNLVRWTSSPLEIAERIGITGSIPRLSVFEDTGGGFFLDEGCASADPIRDDMVLWIDTGDGVAVISGCAHSGIVNALEYVAVLTGRRPVRWVVGGFHLLHASHERIGATADYLCRLAPEAVAPCHCTGAGATEALRRSLGGAFLDIRSGSVLELPWGGSRTLRTAGRHRPV